MRQARREAFRPVATTREARVRDLLWLLSLGRRRPSLRVTVGGLGRLSMSIEASVTRIEAQNKTIAQALIVVLNNQGALAVSQKAQSEAIQSLASSAGTSIDTTALDASIDETDKLIATLASLVSTAPKSAAEAAGSAPVPGQTPGHPVDAVTGKPLDLTDAQRAALAAVPIGARGSQENVLGAAAAAPSPTAPGSAPAEAQSAA